MTQDQILGIARHVLTTFGGILVSKGFIDESSMVALVGAVSTIAGIAWSLYAKRITAKA